MIEIQNIHRLHIELSTKCQAACPLCPRNDFGYKTRTDFPIAEMNISQFQSIFDNINNLNSLKKILFNGNFGDPLMCNDIIDILEYSFNKWPDLEISIHTNGGIRNENWWASFGKKFNKNKLLVHFSIDGLEDTNHIYRINVPYEKAIANAQSFISNGGTASWKMVKFNHNEHQLEEAKLRSAQLGFKYFELLDDGRDYGFVFTSDTDGYWILPASNKNKIVNYRRPNQFQSFSEISNNNLDAEKEMNDKNLSIMCWAKNEQSIYIDATGDVYPCCWTGHYSQTFQKFYNNYKDIVGDIPKNAIKFGLTKAMESLSKIEESWTKKSINDGMHVTCMTKCVKPRNKNEITKHK